MEYYALYIILGSLSILTIYVPKKQKILPALIGAVFILLFQALRWRTGTDWLAYYNGFIYSILSPNEQFELGFIKLNQIIRYISDSYTVFLFVECGLNLLFIILFLNKFCQQNPILGLIYFFVTSIFPIRYTLALSIVLYSYTYIYNKDLVKFCTLIIIAFLIHRSVIIFVPFYFLCRKTYSIKILFLIYFISIILGYASNFTFGYIIRLAVGLYGGMGDVVQSKMDSYISGEIPDYAKMTPFRYLLSIVNSTFFIILFYYYKRKYFLYNPKYNILFNLYVFGISYNRLIVQIVPDFARLTSLFCGGFIIMIIMIISKYSKRNQIALFSVVLLYLFAIYNSEIKGIYRDLYMPYFSIFSPIERTHVY